MEYHKSGNAIRRSNSNNGVRQLKPKIVDYDVAHALLNYAARKLYDANWVEHEKLHDTLLVELMTIQHMLQELGCYDTPGGKKNQILTEQQRMIVGGLMKRLLNQIPAK